ncbi:ATP-binding protein [Lentibacillus cibarius]|uniref:ATP-binding protein n=1 Tax=Lentibacillus cibarius TaxID=2583219 RepID=A0A5S3QJ48_9BACI|nr:ATP-binding protein [Lentibacillus cibarius]TMN21858.1 ATP-binding protein [Lentibacillus cibarius]
MKLAKLHLKNFRGYRDIEVKFNENLNILIGKNDVGKSTILDALNIFFNDEVKPETSDCYKNASEKVIEISISFEIESDELVILDASNPTSLENEYLLNKENLLEVKKVINAGGNSITKSSISVHLNTYHPLVNEKPLITYKSIELKKLLENHKDKIDNYEGINKTKKADMRKAIFESLINEGTIFEEKTINIKDIQDDSIKTWVKLKENLPLYNLFQSDRANTDGDKEVQDPMKAITKEVLVSLQEELDKIRDEVVTKVEEIGNKTIEKLRDFNDEIANELKTIPELKSWDSIFKFNLDTDNEIPLNKRGSGVRRLILLSYFRAQAEKSADETGSNNIIYAIEEPETSQHPDYQRMIVDSLTTIAKQEGNQVFITTHTPEIAQMVNKDALIMITKDDSGNPYIITEEEIKIREVVNTLGILPTIHSSVVICVEGPHDVNFLKNINKTVPEFRDIIDLQNADISIYDLGGSRLINWINLDHFKYSNIKEFHLYDGDIPKYKESVKNMNSINDGRRKGVVTSLREMENYIPPHLIDEHFECDLSKQLINWNDFDVPNYLKGVAMQYIKNDKKRENAIKGILNSTLTQKITADSLKQHGVYEEIEGWFKTISEMYNTTAKVLQ